ncbi:MAG TPA: toxin-antitoxin system HicB family antitoxin [Mycobacteriales bacterium]|nr:toxin-antitoxin system HicB family antitoxin [Mycobacteriales bacterium]
MDLTPYLEGLRRDLATAAAAGSAETQRVAELLANALEPAARLAIMDALTAVAAEVTDALDGPTVEVRLHGREPRVVVQSAATEPPPAPPAADEAAGTVRITLRLPESIKVRLEEAATKEALSVNTWLVRVIARALDHAPNPRSGRRITGYARG